jgi:hypothetical protein
MSNENHSAKFAAEHNPEQSTELKALIEQNKLLKARSKKNGREMKTAMMVLVIFFGGVLSTIIFYSLHSISTSYDGVEELWDAQEIALEEKRTTKKQIERPKRIELWSKSVVDMPASKQRNAFASNIMTVIDDKQITDEEYEELDAQYNKLVGFNKMMVIEKELTPITNDNKGL